MANELTTVYDVPFTEAVQQYVREVDVGEMQLTELDGVVMFTWEVDNKLNQQSVINFLRSLVDEYYQDKSGNLLPAAVVNAEIYDTYIMSLETGRRYLPSEMFSHGMFEGIELYRVPGLPVIGQLLGKSLMLERIHAPTTTK